MRDRHISRVCRNCQAPLARQADSCWRCGVEWAPEEGPRTKLRLVSDRAAESWTDEGGSFAAEAAAQARAE